MATLTKLLTSARERAENIIDTVPVLPEALSLGDFDYPLPPGSIAQQPLAQRDQSRLLVMDRPTGEVVADDIFSSLGNYLRPGDLLIVNDTKVNALRLFGAMKGGGRAEFLLTHRVQEGVWQCLAKPGKRLRVGDKVSISECVEVEIAAIVDERGGRLINVTKDGEREGSDAAIDELGQTPLPPYIHADEPNRYRDRYQTVYAQSDGSAAAPTAGLHFTPELLDNLNAKGVQTASVTLHVGIGTFRPIEAENIADHTMHEESGYISEETSDKIRNASGRIVAVGTTSVRALESASIGRRDVRSGHFETSLFAMPGFKFQTVDSMVTNFHMPRSTLLVLVAAFAGREPILNAYAHALEKGYRFLSFGDSMLIAS